LTIQSYYPGNTSSIYAQILQLGSCTKHLPSERGSVAKETKILQVCSNDNDRDKDGCSTSSQKKRC